MGLKRPFWKNITLITLSLLLLGGAYLCFHLYAGNKWKHSSFSLEHKVSLKDWVKFSPEGEDFSVLFPCKPTVISQNLPIPGSEDSLTYQEYQAGDKRACVYSISYTTLPDPWLRWSGGLVLSGALKMIMYELGKVELIGKNSNTIKGFPALDYAHHSQEKEIAGTLVLVGNRLYKVEVAYPLNLRGEMDQWTSQFIASFVPKEKSPPSTISPLSDKTSKRDPQIQLENS